MSSEATPGYPAPERAWNEVITTFFTPNASLRGLRVIARPTVVQLGVATMNPSSFFLENLSARSSRWPGFTSGIKSGTSPSILWGDASVITLNPAFAKAASVSLAMDVGNGEKTRSASTFEGSDSVISIDPSLAGKYGTTSSSFMPTFEFPVAATTRNQG